MESSLVQLVGITFYLSYNGLPCSFRRRTKDFPMMLTATLFRCSFFVEIINPISHAEFLSRPSLIFKPRINVQGNCFQQHKIGTDLIFVAPVFCAMLSRIQPVQLTAPEASA